MGQGHRGRGGMDRGHGGRQCEVLEWLMGVDIGCGYRVWGCGSENVPQLLTWLPFFSGSLSCRISRVVASPH